MTPEEPHLEKDESPSVPDVAELPPLERGRPMTRDESVERMYRRFDKTFEALAK